ncbi:MAG: gliding motility-associated C-terminal domain-containing protein [Flavobacteriales bacterium]|nr:hypothetical protein [Flavobacteriales bacterium]MCC6576541.1 gliding motility-associated C-terminal domain-containing protein [Flavobacteriales bacterium]NUQ16649.1 gliding motility-associated C-terminal domain-containing protein [Flavobacteriales bacterium]
MRKPLLLFAAMVLHSAAVAQVKLTPAEYDALKAQGRLPAEFELLRPAQQPITPRVHPSTAPPARPKGGGSVNGDCNCWVAPDSTYQLALTPNDDGSSAAIYIPFQFNLYGDLYSTLFINNNGNVSFQSPYPTYSASAFPNADFIMVAPFWADVDTRGDDGMGLNGGQVLYKVTPTALYVNWVDVGYYNSETDKKCTFQLIITDGNDPVIGVGRNVSFCYKDMDWTTGAASQGTNGFGGIPAVVGANRGNGVDYIQFGTFDQPGTAYDGPYGVPDGVDWLDDQNFVFTTSVSTQNIPPIASSTFLCDTVRVCTGELVDIEMNFIAPEQGQVTVASSTAPTLSGYAEVLNTSGNNSVVVQGQFTPTPLEAGFHTITFTATDNGSPPLTTTIDIVVEVYFTTLPAPVIAGDTVACTGQGVTLSVPPLYDTYTWSNGYDGNSVLVGPGTYSVEVTAGYCTFGSNTVVVTEAPAPQPVITGNLFSCGDDPAVLSTTQPYAGYLWSTGSQDPTIAVNTGTYTVTVTNDAGCQGTSAPVNVLTAPVPDAGITATPPGPVFPGTPVTFGDGSSSQDPITQWWWDLGGQGGGTGSTAGITFDAPGSYQITLVVTTANGCTDTATYLFTVVPTEIFVPNVFSPNGDGDNDNLEFTGVEFFPNSDLKVYNRWGQKVYESASYRNQWSPKDVSEGTYYYVLTRSDGKEYTGHVTLLR